MTQLLDIFSFVSVLLRALTLAFEALTVGGVIFARLVRPTQTSLPRLGSLLTWFAALLVVSQSSYVLVNSAILVGTTDLTWANVLNAQFAVSGALVVLGAAGAGVMARTNSLGGRMLSLVACALVVGGSVMGSHSASRLDHRWLLVALTSVHHLGAAAWIGGMPYLIVSTRDSRDTSEATAIVRRFSRMAVAAVLLVAGAGVGLSFSYVGSAEALGGTTYGVMLLAKVVLTSMLLVLGARNRQIVQGLREGMSPLMLHLRRFAEAEAGIGFTVLLAAASLTSTPPAIDVRNNTVTAAEIIRRETPEWPRLETPPLGALSPVTPLAAAESSSGIASFVPGQSNHPQSPADIAWSEYNHHWAGLVVLAIGLVSLLARRYSWARNWPLLFLGLAAFLFVRADSENWPLGPRGFWESFQVAEVAQHRFFVLLIVAFAVFEWAVQNRRLSQGSAGLVFPLVCAVGGAVLLTHSHSLVNVKEEFLAELSHIPLAILAVAAGWSRWLEIRLPQDQWRGFTWIWPVCFILIGGILLNYRES